MISFNIHIFVSILITIFLALIIINHFFKDFFRLNPFYRNNILLEGFDTSGNSIPAPDPSGNSIPPPAANASDPVIPSSSTPSSTPSDQATAPSATAPSATPITPITPVTPITPATPGIEIPDTEKSTIMVDLFEKVNNHMDTIRTLKLSDKFVPINIDKTASDPFVILMNLKLLINNGIYKNELDLKEMYNKYIGNRAIQVLASDINSINMNSSSDLSIESLESSFLTRCKSIVAGHQTIIDQIIENQSKE